MQFREIIGQRELIQKLTSMALGGRVPHAQLFLGYQGNQKLALAVAYGQFLNCKNKQIFSEPGADGLLADSCGTCSSCVKFQKLAHPDLHFFFPNNKTGSMKESDSSDYMDDWRKMLLEHHAEFSLNQWYDAIGLGNSQGYINKRDVDNIIKALTYKNFEAETKIIILWMVEKFYNDISTRLLKVLEEPSEGTVFLLISENSNQIPATILSRTQLIRVPKIDDSTIQHFLQNTYEISVEEASQIARQAKGNLLEAETIVARTDDDSFNHTNFVDWMRICLKVDTPKMDEFSRKMRDLGRERLKLFLNHALEKVRWTVMMNYQNADQVLVSPEEQIFLTKFSPYIHSNNLIKFTTEIEKAVYHVERNANGHLVMLDLSIKLSGLLKRAA
jgi:DNA polymerase-3 subunit delta'